MYHQLSLRYVLQREGVDVRVAQTAEGESPRALTGGLTRLLMTQLKRQGSEEQARRESGVQPVVMVVSDDPRLQRTTYGRNGDKQLNKRILVDNGANVPCISMRVALDCPIPMITCNTLATRTLQLLVRARYLWWLKFSGTR